MQPLTFHIIEGLDLKTQFGVDANFKTLHKYMPSDLVNLAYDQHGRAERYHANTLLLAGRDLLDL